MLEPRNSITLDTYLEQGDSIVLDDTSRVDLVLVKIANLDTGKVFVSTDLSWESIKKQSLSVAGSPVLRNGRVVWTIRSLTDTRMSFEFETRIQSKGSVYVKSAAFTLSPESKFPQFTLLSSDGALTPKTIRADDVQGVSMLFQSENVPTTVDVEITDFVTNKNVLSLRSVPVIQKTLKLGSPAIDPVLHRAGKYVITLTSNGVSDTTDLFVTAGAPKKLIANIPKILLVKEKYVTDFSITDTWGNAINTDSWTGTIHTSQPIIFGQNTEPTQDIALPLSRKFQFQPLKESTLTFDMIAKNNQQNIEQSITVSALEDIQIESNITQT